MDVIEFLKSIYLGDRACKSILIDGWNSTVKVQMTCISRVRSETWNFYTAEDLEDGYIVFEEVSSIEFHPTGPMPNDALEIRPERVQRLGNDDARYLIVLEAASGAPSGDFRRVEIHIKANSMALESRDGRRIRE